MKLNSKILKEKIVNYIIQNPGCIKRLFDIADQNDIDEIELQKTKVWKRIFKGKREECIARYFELNSSQESLNDQIKCEILTDLTDTQIISLVIEG